MKARRLAAFLVVAAACHAPAAPSPVPASAGVRWVPRGAWGAKDPVLPMRAHVPVRLTIHHTGVAQNPGRTIEQKLVALQAFSQRDDSLSDGRRKPAWPDVPYHYYVAVDGSIGEGRDWHYAGDSNTPYDPAGHLLVVVEGNFERDTLTSAQRRALDALVPALARRHGIVADSVATHRDYAATSCPGRGIYAELPHYRAIVGGARSDVQAISLLGDTLRTLPLTPDTRARYEQQLAAARAALEHTPTDADSLIWVGRRLAYLGRIREAIDVFTRGLALHQDDARFLRHRGHRYVTVRDLDRAVVDLERATQLVAGRTDEVEPDGQPNDRGIPIGTLQSNIAYHLGLAYFLKGQFEKAVPVYQRELEAARNDDRRVSTAYWLYLSLRRLGRDSAAAEGLRPIAREMEVIENDTYHRLLLLYKGEVPVDWVLHANADGTMSVTDATAAYGVASFHILEGRRAEGEALLRRIVAGGQWGAFGYIAAEADLARMHATAP